MSKAVGVLAALAIGGLTLYGLTRPKAPPPPVINGIQQTLNSVIASPPAHQLLDYVAQVTGRSYDEVVAVLAASPIGQGTITVKQLIGEVEAA